VGRVAGHCGADQVSSVNCESGEGRCGGRGGGDFRRMRAAARGVGGAAAVKSAGVRGDGEGGRM